MRLIVAAMVSFLMIVVGGEAFAQTHMAKPSAPTKVEVVNTVRTTEVEKPVSPDPFLQPCGIGDDKMSSLCAQWSAAEATRDAVYAAGVSNIIAIVAGILSFVAMIAALAAAWFSRKTLHSERAWMTAKMPWHDWEGLLDGNGFPTTNVSFEVQWDNTGRSPAKNVRAIIENKIVPKGTLPQDFTDTLTLSAGHLAANEWIQPQNFFITPAQARAIITGSHDMYVFSRTKYFDVYESTERETRSCWQVHLYAGPLSVMGTFERRCTPLVEFSHID